MPNTVIALKKSATSTNKPSSLANGELAINFADGILYYKHANGTIASVSGTGGSFNYVGTIDANGTLLVSDTPGDIISIYPGDGVTIVGDAVNDRMYVNAAPIGASANGWANTKLNNSTVTLAGSLTTTGQVTANGVVAITPVGGQEGGEIQLQATGSNTNWTIDSYQNTIRIFTTTGTTVSNLNFFHAGSGFVRMGVNRTDPGYTLDVNGIVNASALYVNGSPISTGGSMDYPFANGVANSANAYAVTVGAASNTFANTKVAAVTSNSNSRIWANTSIDGNNNENVFLDLSTSGVTATTYGGTTQIPSFTVDAYGRLTFAGNNAFTSGGVTITDENASASTFYPVFTLTTTGSMSTANVGTTKLTYVPSTGTLSSTIFNSTSDINRKENIQQITNAVDTISKINGYTFNWKDNGQESIGVIAQEIEKELPCLVADSEDGKSVNYNGLVAILIEIVKKQQKEIEEIKKLLNRKNI